MPMHMSMQRVTAPGGRPRRRCISHCISHLRHCGSSLISSLISHLNQSLISTGVPRGGRAARVPAAHRRGQLDEHRQARALPPQTVLTRSRRVPQPCPYVRGTRTGPRLLRRRAARPRAPRTVLSRRTRTSLGCTGTYHVPRAPQASISTSSSARRPSCRSASLPTDSTRRRTAAARARASSRCGPR